MSDEKPKPETETEGPEDVNVKSTPPPKATLPANSIRFGRPISLNSR